MTAARATSAVGLLASGLLASGLLGAAPAAGPEQAAARLVSELTLPSVEGFDLTQEVAVATNARPPARAEALAARVAGHLAALGLPAPRPLGRASSAREACIEARRAGAEWLLWIDEAEGHLQASLLQIEPGGLWAPPPEHPVSFASARVRLAAPSAPGPAPPPPPPPITPPPVTPPPVASLAVRGPALKVAEIPARVLALAACAEPEGPETLAVLEADAVHLLEDDRGHLRVAAALPLGELPRASARTRDPVWQIVCRGRDLAFGHGGLADGWWWDRSALEASGRPLPGLPLGFDGGRVLVSALFAGTNRQHEAPVWVSADGVARAMEATWPDALWRDYDPTRPEGFVALALTPGYRRWHDGTLGEVVGYGGSARKIQEHLLFVSTAADAGPGRDRVRVSAGTPPAPPVPIGPALDVEGEVHASAVLRRFEGRVAVVLAAWRPALRRTDLLLVAVEEVP